MFQTIDFTPEQLRERVIQLAKALQDAKVPNDLLSIVATAQLGRTAERYLKQHGMLLVTQTELEELQSALLERLPSVTTA